MKAQRLCNTKQMKSTWKYQESLECFSRLIWHALSTYFQHSTLETGVCLTLICVDFFCYPHFLYVVLWSFLLHSILWLPFLLCGQDCILYPQFTKENCTLDTRIKDKQRQIEVTCKLNMMKALVSSLMRYFSLFYPTFTGFLSDARAQCDNLIKTWKKGISSEASYNSLLFCTCTSWDSRERSKKQPWNVPEIRTTLRPILVVLYQCVSDYWKDAFWQMYVCTMFGLSQGRFITLALGTC